jgi:hypothetical protein
MADHTSRPQENCGPKPIREILAELLAQYQVRFPEVRIPATQTAAAAA